MRLISQHPGYKFQIRPQRQRGLGDGGVEITQEPIYAEFMSVNGGAMIYENEVTAALQHFAFRGNTQEQDEATPSDPMLRLSVFDSQEFAQGRDFSPEEIELIEGRLTQLALEAPDEVLMITASPIAAPFPRYDEWDGDDPEQLVVKLIEDGHDLNLVLHYERSFGRNRAYIIETLERAIEMQQEHVVNA